MVQDASDYRRHPSLPSSLLLPPQACWSRQSCWVAPPANPLPPFPPLLSSSGVLVKAVLLGGATAMAGNVQLIDPSSNQWQNLPLEEPPSFRQGFGRLDLANSLPLLSSPLGWNMQARGAEGGRGTGGGGMQESRRGNTGINEHLA